MVGAVEWSRFREADGRMTALEGGDIGWWRQTQLFQARLVRMEMRKDRDARSHLLWVALEELLLRGGDGGETGPRGEMGGRDAAWK